MPSSLGHIFLALLLFLLSCTVGLPADVSRRSDDSSRSARLSAEAPQLEFVLLRQSELPEQVTPLRLRDVFVPPVWHTSVTRAYSPRVFVHKSNAAFIARRNCVCIPLRC